MMSLRSKTLLIVALGLSSLGCQSQSTHSDVAKVPNTEILKGNYSSLHSDLPSAPPELHKELERVHAAIVKKLPWLKTTAPLPTILLAGPESFKKIAQDHGMDPKQGSFSCTVSGDLILPAEIPPRLLGSPEIAGQSQSGFGIIEGVFQQRLERSIPKNRPFTWLEQGSARYMALSLASPEDEDEAKKLLRAELALEFCAIFLGGPRGRLSKALDKTFATNAKAHGGPAKRQRRQEPVTPSVAALFLNEPFEPLPKGLFKECLTADDKALPGLKKRLLALDERYERYVRDRLVGSLFDALATEKDPIERNLADNVLKLILGKSSGTANQNPSERRRILAELRAELSQSAPPTRILDNFKASIQRLAKSRSSRKGFDSLLRSVKKELERRRGYYNNSYDAAVRDLPKAIERELKRLTPRRS
ncbi:MAG: hypothetical protein P1V97_26725 [Planctomycetota bacterium]|nr:hypothetical protein [Planctomycetota bacterium]